MKNSNLHDQYIDELAQELLKEVDFCVLIDLLVLTGWTKVVLPKFISLSQRDIILNWCFDNLKNEWKNSDNSFVFESKSDATWFTLRWI
jgi:hypothetical protein